MNISPARVRLALLATLTLVSLTSCASERYQAEMRKQKADKDKYVDYYPVGSRIPIKVPKDEAKASAEETERTQEVMRDVQRGGVKTPGDPETMGSGSR